MPLTYARLVQPVMEGVCLPCHRQQEKDFQTFTVNGADGAPGCNGVKQSCTWFEFYKSHGGGSAGQSQGYRSQAGDIGARHSRMGKALIANHQTRLTYEQFHRLTLWLDAGRRGECLITGCSDD